MTLREALQRTTAIRYPAAGHEVARTVAEMLQRDLSPAASVIADPGAGEPEPGTLRVFVADGDPAWPVEAAARSLGDRGWLLFCMDVDGRGSLTTSHPNLLCGLCGRVADWLDDDVADFVGGELSRAAFAWAPGGMLTSEAAVVGRGFDHEGYIRECARLGITHMPVNSLASLLTLEPWIEGEVYPVFYRHGAGLDQFVSSRLNKGIFPEEYLRANLHTLKCYAKLVVRYGMTPGLTCVEPRSVPEELLRRYPMLRGARVDHPFRSLAPRYNLSIVHPVVQGHYHELMQNLLHEVPELGFMTIATNDCGAGFEHTHNLYAGRNGSPYLIREWCSHEEIAEAAGKNVVNYVQLLRDAADEIHPGFRVILGTGPLAPELEVIWPGFGPGVDPADGLAALPSETRQELRQRGSLAHVGAATSPGAYPLIAIPAPWATYANLQSAVDEGLEALTGAAEVAIPAQAPWAINGEVWRAVQLGRDIDIDTLVSKTAAAWVGADLAGRLVEAWSGADEAIQAHSPRLELWAGYGFVPYRLWVRPLIPNIEAVPAAERAYYEEIMLAVPNNPTRVDLSLDILFDLITPDEALAILQQMDAHVWAPLDGAIEVLAGTAASLAEDDPARAVFVDQRDRLRGLRCWLRTQRSVAAWIAGVCGYLRAEDDATKAERRALLPEMVRQEIDNTRDLLELWETSRTEFMTVSSKGENTFVYGEDLGDQLRRRIELMEGHEDDEPYIDPDFIWRVSGVDWEVPSAPGFAGRPARWS